MSSRADWESRVLAAIDRDELVDIAQAAIRVPTVNPPGDERALADLLAARLRAGKVPSELLDHDPARASLVGRVRGHGDRPGLILTGHLDVVGAGDQPWQRDPFGGEVVDGRLYGRGSADMKGAVAAMVASALAIVRTGAPLAGDLLLAFTAGEETDSFGAQELAEAGMLAGADAVVVGEPSDLEVYVAEKGNLWLEVTTSGRTAHASMPDLGRNAIYAMADVLTALESYRFPDPPHPLLGSPTLSVGTIRGGVRTNVVPDSCTVDVDVRTLPGQPHERVAADVQELLAEVRRRRPELDVRVRLAYGRDAVATAPDAPIVKEVVRAVADVTGRRPTPQGVMYATDAAVLVPELGVAMAICGPGPRELAHQTDEYVPVDALVAAARIYALVALRRLCAL